MKNVSELLQSVGTLLWPVVVFATILLFRGQLSRAIDRIRKAKVPGFEVELSDELRLAQAATERAAESIPASPVAEGEAQEGEESEQGVVERVLSEASDSPKAALMLLAAKVESEVRELAASRGLLGDRQRVSVSRLPPQFVRLTGLSGEFTDALTRFWNVRNKIVHGGTADSDQILWAIDVGLSLLTTLTQVPRELYFVEQPGLEVYSDEAGRVVRPDVRALVLETRRRDGSSGRRAFPITRGDYVPGEPVTYAFNPNLVVDESWYRDPETNDIKYGWTNSMEFVGRHYSA
jgi:hypothetical protein